MPATTPIDPLAPGSVGVVGVMIPSPIDPCTSDSFSSTVSCPSRYRTVGVNGAEAAIGGDANDG